MDVIKFSAQDWQQYSENAHKIAFNEHKPRDWDRIDFALLVVDADKPAGYVTCREHDSHSVYWQFGGAFPGTKESIHAYRGYQAFVEWCRPRYQRVGTLIENTNTAMLKMAMKVGFRIVGVRNFKGSILLEHLLEFGNV